MIELNLEHCPTCGAALDAEGVSGCPRCLMLAALQPTRHTEGTDRPPPPTLAAVSAAFPQLEVLELIGQGGMGCVFKARQPQLNRFVALKILPEALSRDAAFAARFTREAQALAALSHPNIVTIHDFGQAGGFFYLLMEFVDGVNLRQALRGGHFTPEQALAIVPPLCEALQFAHERGIVHRDIKPENLLLDKAGRIKVADFGIAKMLAASGGATCEAPGPDSPSASAAGKPPFPSFLTADNATAGTPGYMAPEQKATPQRVDSRADIYSLGVVLYEMLTGELPAERLQPPSRKVQIDVRLDEIVLRALEKTPELRYQTAAELRTQVETVVATPGRTGGKFAATGSGTPPGMESAPAIGGSSRGPLRLVMVGRSGEQRVIVWPNVLGAFLIVLGCAVLTVLLLSLFVPITTGQMGMLSIVLAMVVTGAGIIAGLKTPLARLTPLDAEMSTPPAFPAADVGQLQTSADGAAPIPSASASEYVSSWGFRLTQGPAVKTGYVRFWERRFGSVESSGAINTLNLSRIGFVGCLALFAILPGWRWCWPAFGFLGMFVMIGAAYLSEAAARRGVDLSKTRGLPAEQSQRGVWRRRIVWLAVGGGVLPMAFFAFSLLLSLGRNGEKVIEAATTGQMAVVFAKIFAIGSGLTLLIWALLRTFWRKAAKAANPWLRHPEALVALASFCPIMLMAAPFFVWEFVATARAQSVRVNAADWIMLGVVMLIVSQGAVWLTRNLRQTLRAMNGEGASPAPTAEFRAQMDPPTNAIGNTRSTSQNTFIKIVRILLGILIAFIGCLVVLYALYLPANVSFSFANGGRFVLVCLALGSLMLWGALRLIRGGREAREPRGHPAPQLRWHGWDVWIIGLSLATFGALWLERLSGERLQQSLHGGSSDASDIVFRTALATVILLAGAASLWILAKNLQTASGSRATSWKRQLGGSIVPAIAVVLLVRAFIMQPFWAVSDATAPEIPRDSLVLVWKPTRTFTTGELIAYIERGRVNLGRIDKPSEGAVFVKRNDSEPTSVLHSDIVGKVISVIWRGAQEKPLNAINLVRREVREKARDGRDIVMIFEELQRDEKTSTVRIKSVGGGSVGSAMFEVRGNYDIAKARGAACFVNIKGWEGEDGAMICLIGFAPNKDVDPTTYFDLKEPLPADKRHQFLSVKDYEPLFKRQP